VSCLVKNCGTQHADRFEFMEIEMKLTEILLKLVKVFGLMPTIVNADSLDGNVHAPFMQSTGESTNEKTPGVEL
jgi:hypothetical protein